MLDTKGLEAVQLVTQSVKVQHPGAHQRLRALEQHVKVRALHARARPMPHVCLNIPTQQGRVFTVDASLRGSVRGRDKIFGALNFWVLFNREYSVRINRIGARSAVQLPRALCPASRLHPVNASIDAAFAAGFAQGRPSACRQCTAKCCVTLHLGECDIA